MTHLEPLRSASVLASLLLGIGLSHTQDSAVYDTQQSAWKLYYQDPQLAIKMGLTGWDIAKFTPLAVDPFGQRLRDEFWSAVYENR